MDDKKKTFVMPEAELVSFVKDDIILTSLTEDTDRGFDDPDADTY